MTKDEIIRQLKAKGYNNDASATQQDLYTTINRGQLYSNSNRLNAGWARGKYVIAGFDQTSYSENEYIKQWLSKVERYHNQYLCLEVRPNNWHFYDSFGTLIPFNVIPPQLNLPVIYDKEEIKEAKKEKKQQKQQRFRNYITAIKSKPFLLLAGISGTGKSRIVRELARACWDEGSEEYESQKPRNYEMVQVKPNWHDSSELIGYVSRVGEKPVFVAGEFLKFVARSWEEPDVPYFLCLDEMNLAPVEQYFAEYLSVIESRKADGEGTITSDPILKKSKEDWYRILTSELTDDDDLRRRFLEDGICIPQNLIVVGTVNMDETTFSFSRKVLDRAMTIEMNEVNLKGGLDVRHEKIGKLGAAELIGNTVEGVDVYNAHKDVCDTAIDYLQKINDELEGTPFKIAYRTRNEALLYVVNNLPYKKDEESEEEVIRRALDEITNMKILSRIEGDADKIGNLLERLSKVIKEQLGEQYTTENSFSLKKLEEMEGRLKSGYTSFWS